MEGLERLRFRVWALALRVEGLERSSMRLPCGFGFEGLESRVEYKELNLSNSKVISPQAP